VDNKFYTSNRYDKYKEMVLYYKKHPFKYIISVEQNFNLKLKWHQKIKLFLFSMGLLKTKYQKRQEKLDKLLRKYIN